MGLSSSSDPRVASCGVRVVLSLSRDDVLMRGHDCKTGVRVVSDRIQKGRSGLAGSRGRSQVLYAQVLLAQVLFAQVWFAQDGRERAWSGNCGDEVNSGEETMTGNTMTGKTGTGKTGTGKTGTGKTGTGKTGNQAGTRYRVREAVGVFADPDALFAAIEELELAGFDRSAISVLASDAKVKERIGRLYRTAAEAEDDGRMPRAAFVSPDSRAEGAGAAVAVPLYLAGIAGAFVVAASGGTLAAAVAAAVGSGAAGAGVGAILAGAVARQHTRSVEERLARGGLVLWVGVPNKEAETRALAVLERSGAGDIHVHEVTHRWGAEQRNPREFQPGPFLT
jgi:hypothetical protein